MTENLKISVILPAFNEEGVIAEVVNGIIRWFDGRQENYEVIVVNDGSDDQTARIVKDICRADKRVRLINHEKNLGYGPALNSGFEAATGKWIFQMDADGQFRIDDLQKLEKWTDEFSVVVGYRSRRSDSQTRKLLTWGYNKVLNLLFGLGVRDVGCAYKLFRRVVWERVRPINSQDHKIYLAELLLKIKRAGLEVKEVPVEHFARRSGKATGMSWMAMKGMLGAMIRLKLYE